MAGMLGINEKVELVRLYSASNKNAAETRQKMYQKGIDEGKWGKVGISRVPLPSYQTILNVNKVFDETGCVDRNLLKTKKRKRSHYS